MHTGVTTHASLLARLGHDADTAAWDEFVGRYTDVIRGFTRRRGLQPADADDLVQDVFVRLSSAMRSFEYNPGRGKFRSYLKTIVVRAISDRLSQKKGPATVSVDDGALPGAADDDALWEMEWRRYHVRQAMRTIVMEFNAHDVRAFEAYAIDGRDAAEVARTLGRSVDQVYQAKSLILRRLSALIEQQIADEG